MINTIIGLGFVYISLFSLMSLFKRQERRYIGRIIFRRDLTTYELSIYCVASNDVF